MAVYRRRISALGNFLEDNLRSMITTGAAPQIPWNAVQPDGNGFFVASAYSLFNGREETPGFIVWRDDAGTVHGIAIATSDYAAPVDYQAAIAADRERLRQNIIATRSAQIETAIPTFASAYASGDPAYAEYWRLYGAFPTTHDAQFNWLVNAMLGGVMEAGRQDWVDSQTGWEGFLNNTFPIIAASALVGAMIAPVVAAQGFSYGPTGMVSDVVSTEFPGLFGTEIGDVIQVADSGEILSDIGDSASGYGYGTPESLIDPQTGSAAWASEPSWWEVATEWERAQVDAANENMALAEVRGDVPAGTLANTIGENIASGYLERAQEILAGANPDVINVADDEKIERVTVTAQKPVDEIVYQYSPSDLTPVDGSGNVIVSSSGGGMTTTQVLQTVAAGAGVLTAGAGLVRQLTASDGTREVPMVYASGPDGLPVTPAGNTLSQGSSGFPWWLLIAGALAVSGN